MWIAEARDIFGGISGLPTTDPKPELPKEVCGARPACDGGEVFLFKSGLIIAERDLPICASCGGDEQAQHGFLQTWVGR
jgi:hypothetical protein